MQKGQSLFEVVVAIGVVALLLTGLASAVTRSVSNTTFAKNQSIANRYSQQAVEWMRTERDTSWDQLANGVGSSQPVSVAPIYCINTLVLSSANDTACTTNITNEIFKREVSFSCYECTSSGCANPITCNLNRVNNIRAVVATYWTDGSGTHSVKNAAEYSEWR